MTDVGFGPLGETVDGLRYHGAPESHEFKVYPGFQDRTVKNYSCQRWDRMCDTFEEPEVFCGSCSFVTDGPRGSKVYQCAGHRVGESDPTPAGTGITPPRGAETVTVGHGLDETVDIPEPRSTADVPDSSTSVVKTEPTDETEIKPKRQRKAEADRVMDFWEIHPERGAFVRVINHKRRKRFDPHDTVGEDGAPDPDRLDPKSVVFAKSGGIVERLETNDWRESPVNITGKDWTGEIWFWVAGKVTEPIPMRGVHLKGDLEVGEIEDSVMDSLLQRPGAPPVGREDLFGTLAIERVMFEQAQRQCAELAPYYAVLYADDREGDAEQAVRELFSNRPELASKHKVSNVIHVARLRYELVERLLYRRVWDASEGDTALRCCVPDQPCGMVEIPGVGKKPMQYRQKIMFEYHNGPIAGHTGRDRTIELIERDFWWEGLYSDVCAWCKSCALCQATRARTGLSAARRVELYSHPFRVLQVDIVDVGESEECEGYKNVLTAVCPFSRWAWLLPMRTRTAPEVAVLLVTRVFCDVAGFPVILRTDWAPEFVGEVLKEINSRYGIQHITGSTYHPQTRGHVESMHKTMSQFMVGLLDQYKGDWVDRLPYAQLSLRTIPMKALGGRTPYEVVTGMKARIPKTLMDAGIVEQTSVDEYVSELCKYLEKTYANVKRIANEALEAEESKADVSESSRILVGDIVMVRRNRYDLDSEYEGPRKWQRKCYPNMYRVRKALGRSVFDLEDVTEPTKAVPFKNPQNEENLVRIDLPEMDLRSSRDKCVEVYDDESTLWVPWRIRRMAVDGRVYLQSLRDESVAMWTDLTNARYRWISEPGRVD